MWSWWRGPNRNPILIGSLLVLIGVAGLLALNVRAFPVLDVLLQNPGQSSFITAVATCVIAAFTIVLSWATSRMWKVTESSAATAERSAHAFVRAEMAHIVMVGLAMKVLSNTPSSPKWTLLMKNAGRSPAYIHRVLLDFGFADSIRDLPVGVFGVKEYGFFLAPGETHRPTDGFGTEEITLKQLALSDSQGKKLFVWGSIEFDNGFEQTWVSGFAFHLKNPDQPRDRQKAIHIGGPRFWRYEKLADAKQDQAEQP